jgi:cytochrome c-type biogenesis protein
VVPRAQTRVWSATIRSATAFLRRHVRTINLLGGALLILLGILMLTGVWTAVMSALGSLVGSIQLPL